MKRILPVLVTLAVILTGCAAKQDQSGTGHAQSAPAMEPEQTGTVSGDSPANVINRESAMENVPEPEEPDYATAKMSVNEVYNISYRSVGGAIRVGRTLSWELTISDKDGQPVNDARVLLAGNMPGKEYSLPVTPVVTRAGFAGLYRVEDLLFNMPGRWTISVEIMADNGMPDSVTFDLDIR